MEDAFSSVRLGDKNAMKTFSVKLTKQLNDLVAIVVGDFFEGPQGSGNRHRNFGRADTPAVDRVHRADRAFGGVRADNGNDADAGDGVEDFAGLHTGKYKRFVPRYI